MPDITDESVVAGAVDHFSGDHRYRATSAVARGDRLVLELSINDEERVFGLEVALPSSTAVHYWLYAPPVDASDWLGQLKIWVDEEIYTGAANWAATEERDGINYFVVDPYGFSTSDPTRHVNLTASAGPNDWSAYPGA